MKRKILQQIIKEIAEAREQVKRGELYSQEEVMEKFELFRKKNRQNKN